MDSDLPSQRGETTVPAANPSIANSLMLHASCRKSSRMPLRLTFKSMNVVHHRRIPRLRVLPIAGVMHH
jgi:hypothetical protein